MINPDDPLDLGPGWQTQDGVFYEFQQKGCVELLPSDDGWLLGLILTYRAHRGTGIGTRMLQDIKSIDSQPVWLSVDPQPGQNTLSAPALKQWYIRQGFTEHPTPTRYSRHVRMVYYPQDF